MKRIYKKLGQKRQDFYAVFLKNHITNVVLFGFIYYISAVKACTLMKLWHFWRYMLTNCFFVVFENQNWY